MLSAHPSWSVMNHIATTGLYNRIPELEIFHRLVWSKGPQFTRKSMFCLDFAVIATPNTMQIINAAIRYQPTKKSSTWTQQNTWRLASQHEPLEMLWLVACIAFMHLLLPIMITGTYGTFILQTHLANFYRSPLGLALLIVMQMAQLGAIEPLSWAVILASQADKSAPGSELLRPAWAMPQVLWMSDLLDSFKPSENNIKHCLQGPSAILNVYFCILLARAILQACFVIGTRR